jgi:uncharacterized coiled-coil DUF342 family protein
MSDCDGMDAFKMVLDELLETNGRLQTYRQERDDANDRARQASEQTAAARQHIVADQRDAEQAKPKLKELWEAADDVRRLLMTADVGIGNVMLKRFADAMNAAADACGRDEMPF